MNKKFLGLKIGTVLTVLVCLAVSFLIWMLVKYNMSAEAVFARLCNFPLFRG